MPQSPSTGKILEAGHADLVGAVAAATRISEKAIYGVGERLGTIVSTVLEQHADLEGVRERVASFDVDGSMGEDLARGYLEEFRRHLDESAPLFEEFADHTSGLLELLDDLDQIAGTSALLAVTARIETGRLQNRGVAGIVQDLDVLNDEVRQIGEEIGAHTRDLGAALRELVALRNELEEEASGFARRLGDTAEQVARELAAMRSGVEAHLETHGARVERVLHDAREALSHLQYQDPMVQSLQRVDWLMTDARNSVDAATGGPGGVETLAFASNLSDHLDPSQDDVAPSGSVLLF